MPRSDPASDASDPDAWREKCLAELESQRPFIRGTMGIEGIAAFDRAADGIGPIRPKREY